MGARPLRRDRDRAPYLLNDGADEHGILAMIDRIVGGGVVRELLPGMDPDPWLDVFCRSHEVSDDLVCGPLEPARARRLLEDAIAASNWLLEHQPDMSTRLPAAYCKMRALTLARARVLSDVAAPPELLSSGVEIELLNQSFLASDIASALADLGIGI